MQLTKVEEIYLKIRNGVALAITYVFPLSYFLGKENYVNNNPEWNIEHKDDIAPFSKALIDTYTRHIKDFIPFITQPKNMLNFLLSEIATGKDYANTENVFIRALILMKLLNYPTEEIQKRLTEFKFKLVKYDEDIKQEYYKQMDDVVAGNW